MLWKVLPKKSDDLLEQLLINRGIKTKKEKDEFFHPKLASFEKQLNIPGIAKAKKRIEQAIKAGELIIAYGDYDVDGICGAAVLYLGLTSLGAKVLPYIPHREKEGYGLSKLGLETVRGQGASVVISVDCGIVNFEEAKFAKELGLDLIITDHHQIDKKKPDSFAIVHSTSMCGTAVAWCLVRSLMEKNNSEELLDLVGIATITDMMALIRVNRALVKSGLEKLNKQSLPSLSGEVKTERVGLSALYQEAGIIPGKITSYEIGHIIGPRLNAIGRLEHAIDGLRLLCTKDPGKARKLASLISETNSRRQQLTLEAVDEAKLMINGSKKKIHVLSSANWSQGIIGLVAGRVCDETGCSAIAIAIGEQFSKGSARAGHGVNMVEMLRSCADILVAVGGHKGAAGFTIETNKIVEFQKRLEERNDGQTEEYEPALEIEGEVLTKDLSIKLANELNDFEPFGTANPKPILASFGMRLSDLRTVGESKHLKGKADGVDFIAFGMGSMMDLLQDGQLVDLAYNLEIDRFNGFEKLQLKVKDLKLS